MSNHLNIIHIKHRQWPINDALSSKNKKQPCFQSLGGLFEFPHIPKHGSRRIQMCNQ